MEPGKDVESRWADAPMAAKRRVARLLTSPRMLGELRVGKAPVARAPGRPFEAGQLGPPDLDDLTSCAQTCTIYEGLTGSACRRHTPRMSTQQGPESIAMTIARARGRMAVAPNDGRDSERAQRARRDLFTAKVEKRLRDLFAEAPDISADQRQRLGTVLGELLNADE